MLAPIHRIFRMTFVVILTGLVLVMSTGCATTGGQTASFTSKRPVVEQAKSHPHTPWRYRGRRGRRSMRPRYRGQKPVVPCKPCDDASEKG